MSEKTRYVVGVCAKCKKPLRANENYDFCKEIQPGLFQVTGELDSSGLMCECNDDSGWLFYDMGTGEVL